MCGRSAPHMQAGLRSRFAEHPLVGEVRGIGLLGAIELVADKEARTNFDPAMRMSVRLARLCEQNGVIVRPLTGDVLAFSPPLIITAEESRRDAGRGEPRARGANQPAAPGANRPRYLMRACIQDRAGSVSGKSLSQPPPSAL